MLFKDNFKQLASAHFGWNWPWLCGLAAIPHLKARCTLVKGSVVAFSSPCICICICILYFYLSATWPSQLGYSPQINATLFVGVTEFNRRCIQTETIAGRKEPKWQLAYIWQYVKHFREMHLCQCLKLAVTPLLISEDFYVLFKWLHH